MTAIYPREFIADLGGKPLDLGAIYVGVANQDPQTNPVQCYWDAALTIPAAQPISVYAGYPVNTGSRADVYTAATSYSLRIRDKSGAQVDYIASVSTTNSAGLISFSQASTYAAGSAGAKLQQNNNPLDAPYSAAGNGTTNDRTALFNADAAGPIVITGNHRVSSNLTFTKTVMFVGNGRLTIDGGVTVTFADGVAAPDRQVFYGTGAVAGLREVKVAWFAGDYRGTTTNAVTYLQKALDAAATLGTVLWDGSYATDGSAYLTVSKGQSVVSSGRNAGKLVWTGTACLGFKILTTEGAKISSVWFDLSSIAAIPASGIAVWVTIGNCVVEKCYSTHCYEGVRWDSINGGKDFANNFNGATYSANYIYNSPNIEITNASGSAYSDWLECSTTASFIAGEALTFSGGATGSWGYTCSATVAKIVINDVTPANGATITGGTSGATATITSITKGHQGGGLRLANNAAGCEVIGSAWSGGVKAGVSTASVNAHGTRPEYCTITGCFFDHSDEQGFFLEYGAGMKFTNSWFSSRNGEGFQSNSGFQPVISGCNLSHSWNTGLLIGVGTIGLICTSSLIEGNNRSNNGKSGVYVIAGTTDFIIQSNRIGGDSAAGFGGTQARPVIIEVGASDRYVVKNNLVSGNTNNAVNDGGTGVNKTVGENY